MHTRTRLILRLGLALTFIWVGILIFQQPDWWSGFLPTWFAAIVPIDEPVFVVGVIDILIGILLLFNVYTWIVSIAAALHMVGIFATSGIDSMTVRDIGLLAASIVLSMETMPHRFRFWDKEKAN